MSFPSTLRILGTRWTVEPQPRLFDDDAKWGETDFRTLTISLDPVADQPTVLLHEVIHAIEFAQGLDLKESEVQLLARGLAATIADNPEFRDWLLKGTG